MAVEQPLAAGCAELSEDQFYSSYAWCLNPVLTLDTLQAKLQEEMVRSRALTLDWQRRECRVNLYLFACAIACTVEDYLSRRNIDLASVAKRLPGLRWPLRPAQPVLRALGESHRLVRDWRVARWAGRWRCFVDQVCEIVVREAEAGDAEWHELEMTLRSCAQEPLPRRVRTRRMQLPCPYRSQDLTHYDVIALVRLFAEACPDRRQSVAVVGARTTGSYFAPLARAELAALGWRSVEWIAMRPRVGLSWGEQRRLRQLLHRANAVVLIDDHPNTGRTFGLLLRIVRQAGAGPEQVTILAPRHPVRPAWGLDPKAPGARGVRVLTLEPAQWHKTGLLEARAAQMTLDAYFTRRGWDQVEVQPSAEVDATNARLQRHFADGWHVRLKRVFEVRLSRGGDEAVTKRVLAKSVGWGWLGYHAYLVGTRLAGFVPPVIGLRDGLLFTDWLEETPAAKRNASLAEVLSRCGSYLAARARRLRLAEDPCFDDLEYGRTGWSVLVDALRAAYGSYVGRLKIPALHRRLRAYRCPAPVLVDGHMRPDEWMHTADGLYKVDFEHHNFGRTEMNIVDPAYDLACAVFEFGLSEQAEKELVQTYIAETGDRSITERLLPYKLICGVQAMESAALGFRNASERHRQEECDERRLAARSFLTHQLNRYCAAYIVRPRAARWTRRLFFLDLDGVFDREVLNFAHPTASGLTALALLQTHGFAVVLNTGRSVAHVRNYCSAYQLPGGLAEYGSVLVDAVRGVDLPLIDDKAAEQLASCREALRARPDVFLDPEYKYAIRAYHYDGQRLRPLGATEVESALREAHCERLTFLSTTVDTYIVQQGVGKGGGLLAAKEHLGCVEEAAVAIGDSEQDLPMLEAAQYRYAPASCAAALRNRADALGVQIQRQPYQRGLLSAVRQVLGERRSTGVDRPVAHARAEDPNGLIAALLEVAERPRWRQVWAVLNWRAL